MIEEKEIKITVSHADAELLTAALFTYIDDLNVQKRYDQNQGEREQALITFLIQKSEELITMIGVKSEDNIGVSTVQGNIFGEDE